MDNTVIEIGGNSFRLKYKYLLPPLSPEQRADLKADIERRGFLTPIIATGTDLVIIDGANRVEIAAELGLDFIHWNCVHPATEDEEREMAISANLHRRHMTREQRAEWVAKLRAEGWSTPKIAEAVGVSDHTIRQDLKNAGVQVAAECATSRKHEVALPDRVVGQDGKERPAEKPTVDELAERRAKAAELKEAGKTRKEIASNLGVSVRTVANDLSVSDVAADSEPESPHVPWENTWTRVMKSHIHKWSSQLAMFRKSARATPPQIVDWEECPSLDELESAARSLDYLVRELRVERDLLGSAIDSKTKSIRPALRVVGGSDV